MSYCCCTSTVHCNHCKRRGEPPGVKPFDFKAHEAMLNLDHFRATGRSTLLAFEVITESMKRPEVGILIKDHHPTREADRHLAYMIQGIIVSLQYKNFYIKERQNNLYLTYTGFKKCL